MPDDVILCPDCRKPHPLAGLYVSLGRPVQPCGACRRRRNADLAKHPASNGMKWCPTCAMLKPVTQFGRNTHSPNGLMRTCKLCANHHQLWYTFGLTNEDYSRMLDAQHGVCAICGQPETARHGGRSSSHAVKRLAVDHDHDTGEIRGLLCAKCNQGIGCFDDDPNRLHAATRYLERAQRGASATSM